MPRACLRGETLEVVQQIWGPRTISVPVTTMEPAVVDGDNEAYILDTDCLTVKEFKALVGYLTERDNSTAEFLGEFIIHVRLSIDAKDVEAIEWT